MSMCEQEGFKKKINCVCECVCVCVCVYNVISDQLINISVYYIVSLLIILLVTQTLLHILLF